MAPGLTNHEQRQYNAEGPLPKEERLIWLISLISHRVGVGDWQLGAAITQHSPVDRDPAAHRASERITGPEQLTEIRIIETEKYLQARHLTQAAAEHDTPALTLCPFLRKSAIST